MRDSLCVLLGLAGFQCFICASAADLLALLKVQTAECLILDVHMPDMTGLELAARLNAANITIPIVLISGNMAPAIEENARQLGITHLLRKPFSGAILIETVQRITG